MASTVHRYSTPAMPYFPDITTMRSNATRPKAKDWSDLASAPLKPATRIASSAPSCSGSEEPQHYLHSLRRTPNLGEYTAAEVTIFPGTAKSQLAFSPPKLPSPPDTPATVEDTFDMGSHSNMLKLEKMLDELQLDSDRTALGSADKSDMQVNKQHGADPSAGQGNAHGLPTRLGLRSAAPSAPRAAGVPPVARPYSLPGLAAQQPAVFAPSQGYTGVQQRPSQSSVVHPPIRGALRATASCGMLPFDYQPPGTLPDVGKTVGPAQSPYGVLLPIAERNLADNPVDVARSTRAWHTQVNLAGEQDNQACLRGQILVPTSFSASSASSGTVSRPQSRQVFSLPVSLQNGWVFDENAQLIDPLDGMPYRIAEEFLAQQQDLGGALIPRQGGTAFPFSNPHGSVDSAGMLSTVPSADVGRFTEIGPRGSAQQQLLTPQLSGVVQPPLTSSIRRGRGSSVDLRINTAAAGRYSQPPTPPLMFGTPLVNVPATVVAVHGAKAHHRQGSASSTASNGQTGTPLASPVGASGAAGPAGRDPKKLSLYKTELCRSFEETGTCRYGVKCQFAHGAEELRMVERHPKHKSVMCKTFWEKGSCPYGQRCCFIHTAVPSEHGSIFIQSRAVQGAVSSVSVTGSAASLKSPAAPKDADKKRDHSLPLYGLYTQENDAVNATINANADPGAKLVTWSNPVSPTNVETTGFVGTVREFDGRARRENHAGAEKIAAAAGDVSMPSLQRSSRDGAGSVSLCGTCGSREPCAACVFALPAAARANDVSPGDGHVYAGTSQFAGQHPQQLNQARAVRRASFADNGVRRLPVFQSIQH